MSDSATERVRFERRLAAYREMADIQIEAMLASMMTICRYGDVALEVSHYRVSSRVSRQSDGLALLAGLEERKSSEDLFYQTHKEHLAEAVQADQPNK